MTRLCLLLASTLCVSAGAAEMPFQIADTFAVGGWQEREEIVKNAKGKTTDISVVWMGIVGAETRDGIDHVWLEARIQQYKEKRNGDRKPTGDRSIMKTLVERSALGDFSNPMAQMRKFAKEIIFQAGDAQPMRLSEGGMLANMMVNAFGLSVDFQAAFTGAQEDIEVPAGTISAYQLTGSGTTEMKIMVRTMRVESETDTWLSPDVPLAVVKQTTRSITNGKASVSEGRLLRYSTEGAVSMIDDATIQEMPSIELPF